MTIRSLVLSDSERLELRQWRDTGVKPFQRERASALLKIADGTAVAHVARTGLLRPRDPDTLYSWLKRYQEGGVEALMKIGVGRGRKPAFFPSQP